MMRRTSRAAIIASGIIALILAAVMLGFAVNAANDTAVPTDAITSALISKEQTTLEIKAKLTAETIALGDMIYLFELLPYQSASQVSQMTPVAQEKAEADITFKLPFDTKNRPRLFAKYLLAVKNGGSYSIVGAAHYIDNPEAAAIESFAYPSPVSKKGLQVQNLADAQELGAAATVLNVLMDEYIQGAKETNSIAYVFYNQTFYFNKERVEYLDHRVKVLSEAGMTVYINLLLGSPSETLDEKVRSLYFPESSPTADFYAINAKSQDAVMYLEAFVSFLAERYTRSDGLYGFAGSFILGYEVNSAEYKNSAGPMTLGDYLNSYIVAFRITDTALRSVYTNGRVYLPLGNNYTRAAPYGVTDTGDLMSYYPAKELLEVFSEKVKYAGDIPWNVAVNAYPSDPANPVFWNDDNAWDNQETPFLTMKNINILTELLTGDKLLFNGRQRSVLIKEFGVSADPDSPDVSKQAAAIAYAYYKAAANPMIEAIIYHRHVDNADEAAYGLWYGLWTRGSDSISEPLAKKTAYNVFKYMDTDKTSSATAFALGIIGAESWDKLITGFKESSTVKRRVFEDIPVLATEITRKYSARLLYDFSEGDLFNFYPSDNTTLVELRADPDTGNSKMYSAAVSSNPNEYMGVSSVFTKPLNIKGVHFITARLKAEAPAGVANVSIMLRIMSKADETRIETVLYEGVGQIKTGEWTDITFKIDELDGIVNSIDSLKLWIKPLESVGSAGGYGLWLDTMNLYARGGFPVWGIILIIIGILLLAAVGYFAFLVVKAQIIRARREKLRAERDRARAEAARLQRQAQINQTRQIQRRRMVENLDDAGRSAQNQPGQQSSRRPPSGQQQNPHTQNRQHPQSPNRPRGQNPQVQIRRDVRPRRDVPTKPKSQDNSGIRDNDSDN